VPDLLIAATAETYGAVIVHYDHDFDTIAMVTGQPAQWIVPAGSVP
jgi:predicted nucleic acid-binding protein